MFLCQYAYCTGQYWWLTSLLLGSCVPSRTKSALMLTGVLVPALIEPKAMERSSTVTGALASMASLTSLTLLSPMFDAYSLTVQRSDALLAALSMLSAPK